MRKKHLELIQKESSFFIRINSIVGRVSLLFDHPVFSWVQAKDLKNKYFKTQGQIRLVPMRRKDLFIMEDVDKAGFKAQNFIYVADEISAQFEKLGTKRWMFQHLIEFLTKSISIFYVILFLVLHDYIIRNYGTRGVIKLSILFGPPGMMILPSFYYIFWSSKTKSSFLKFFFRFELMLMVVMAVFLTVFFTFMNREVLPWSI